MSKKPLTDTSQLRRQFTDQFKADAVKRLLDGHSASSIADGLGLSGTNLLYRWKREQLRQSGHVASSLENRVKELEAELQSVERERDILKKGIGYFQPKRLSDRFAAAASVMDSTNASATEVCQVLSVSRSSFYGFLGATRRDDSTRAEELSPLIIDIFWKHRRRYGARRIASEPADRAIVVCRRTVTEAMNSQGFKAIQPKSLQPRTTDSRHRLEDSRNLLLGPFELNAVNRRWVANITYIPMAARRFA